MQVTTDLLQAARTGDRKAQYQLYRLCYPVLMGVCARYRQGEQDAVAALNTAFLNIIKSLDNYPENASFEAWIRRIQINVLIDEFRKQKRYREQIALPENLEIAANKQRNSDWNQGEKTLEAGYLERLMQKLPPLTRQVFNLFALDGFSHAEISEMLGISDGTSKWHVSVARSQLRTWLSQQTAE